MARLRAERVAVLADVHGNLPALSAVLAEPNVAAADAVVLPGDIALGPMPAQTLEMLAGLGARRSPRSPAGRTARPGNRLICTPAEQHSTC